MRRALTMETISCEKILHPFILESLSKIDIVGCRNLQTAYGNRGNTVSQHLKHLKPKTEYEFSVQVQVPSPAGVEYCSVYVYMGHNATVGNVASAQLFNFGEWESLTGTYKAKRHDEILNIVAACDSEDSSVTGNVYIDEVSFTGVGHCKSSSGSN